MTQQKQGYHLRQHESINKEEPKIKDTLKRWIQPPTFLFSIVIISELYIVIAYHITDVTLLTALLITSAVFANIRIKDIITMVATLKDIPGHEDIEHDKDTLP